MRPCAICDAPLMSPRRVRGLRLGITDRMRTCLACWPLVGRSPEVASWAARTDEILDMDPRLAGRRGWRGSLHIAGCLRRDRIRAERAAESRLRLERATVSHGLGQGADRRA